MIQYRKWTLGKKLWLLCTVLLINMCIVGAVNLWNTQRLVHQMNDIAEIQLPAVRNMTLVDMMHDGIRAVVFHSMLASNNTEESEGVKKELDEFTNNINTYLANISALQLSTETQLAIETSKEPLKNYVTLAHDLVALASSGKLSEVKQKLPSFNEAFEGLEKSLGALGERIEKDANVSQEQGANLAKESNLLSTILLAVGFIIGILISALITKSLLGVLRNMILKLSEGSQNLDRYASEISSASQELDNSSTQQASAVQETAASVEQISAMVAKTSENSNNLGHVVQKSYQSASQGQTNVTEMLNAMQLISQSNLALMSQVTESNTRINEIVKVISEIGEKTKVIDDIVFQTKLLSFNASVEAARAGEHGKGFAVVAEEVGNLAQMSGNAAKEISSMLGDSIQRATSIVAETKQKVEGLMHESRQKVEQGVTVAKSCGSALDAISKQVGDVNGMTSQITTAISEQTQGTREISKAINLFNQSTQQNTSIAKKANDVAKNLIQEAHGLGRLAHEFESLLGNNTTTTETDNTHEQDYRSAA